MIPASGPDKTERPIALPLKLKVNSLPAVMPSKMGTSTKPSLFGSPSSARQFSILVNPFTILTLSIET